MHKQKGKLGWINILLIPRRKSISTAAAHETGQRNTGYKYIEKYLMTTNEWITLCINLLQNHRVIQHSLSCSIRQRVLSASSQQNNIYGTCFIIIIPWKIKSWWPRWWSLDRNELTIYAFEWILNRDRCLYFDDTGTVTQRVERRCACRAQPTPWMGILYVFFYMNTLAFTWTFVHYKWLIFKECQIAGLCTEPASLSIYFVNILFQIYWWTHTRFVSVYCINLNTHTINTQQWQ